MSNLLFYRAAQAETGHSLNWVPGSPTDGYTLMLKAFGFDTQMTSVVWALLFDGADAILSRTSSRRIAERTGLNDRTVSRYLVRLHDMDLLVATGRSLTNIRYSLDREALIQRCQDRSRVLPMCFVANPVLGQLQVSYASAVAPRWIVLLCQLGYDYPRAAALLTLLRHADPNDGIAQVTCRDIEAETTVPRQTVHRALKWLENHGLVVCGSRSEYCVQIEVVRALLEAPLPRFQVLPGITPLPALQRLFPASPSPSLQQGGVP